MSTVLPLNYRRTKIVFGFLFAALFSSACSMRQFALEHHEFFATRLAVHYLDLHHDQKDQFKRQWRLFSARVAASKIEPMAVAVEALADLSDPSPLVEDLQQRVRDILQFACTDFAPVAVGLKADQQRLLRERIKERNERLDPQHSGGVAKHRKNQQKELSKSVEKWLGSVNLAQRKYIAEMDQSKSDDGQWERDYLAYSLEAQDHFIAIISESDAGNFEKKCIDLTINLDTRLSPESRKTKLELAEARARTLRVIFQSMDSVQRSHLKHETSKLARELRHWAAKTSAAH